MRYHAYLVVICHPETNAILDVAIWSSPEWEQSRQLNYPTYIAWAVGGNDFQSAMDYMVSWMIGPYCRYSYLLQYIEEKRLQEYLSRVGTWTFESFYGAGYGQAITNG